MCVSISSRIIIISTPPMVRHAFVFGSMIDDFVAIPHRLIRSCDYMVDVSLIAAICILFLSSSYDALLGSMGVKGIWIYSTQTQNSTSNLHIYYFPSGSFSEGSPILYVSPFLFFGVCVGFCFLFSIGVIL